MAKIKKYRKEKYIKQRVSSRTGTIAFQVSFTYKDAYDKTIEYAKSFSELDYSSASEALEQACKHRDAMRYQLSTVGIAKSQKVTLREVFEDTKSTFTFRAETNRKHNLVFNKYIAPGLEDKDITKIKAIDIQLSLNKIVESANDKQISYVFSIWKTIFRTARINRYVSINICEEVICPKSMIYKAKKEVSTDYSTITEVIESLRKRTSNNDKYIFDTEIIIFAITVMYYTGLRPSECFALTRKDIDFNRKTININKQIGTSLTDFNVIRSTKTESSNRELPMLLELQNTLVELFNYQDNDYLFANFNGELFNVATAVNKITRCCKQDGLHFNMYRLRHQFSTDLVTNNVDPRTVMELMGHNNVNMTVSYARSNEELKKDALETRKTDKKG